MLFLVVLDDVVAVIDADDTDVVIAVFVIHVVDDVLVIVDVVIIDHIAIDVATDVFGY